MPRKPRTKRTSVQQRRRQRSASHPRFTPFFFLLLKSYPILKERAEASKWDDGAKSTKKSKEEKEEKRKAELARKAENARLLAEEAEKEEALRAKKAAAKPPAKKGAQPKPAGPGAIAAGGEPSASDLATSSAESPSKNSGGPQEVESFAATGIDNALDLLEVVTAKVDKASIGNQAAGIEKHPEVCNFAFADRSSLTETIVFCRDDSK